MDISKLKASEAAGEINNNANLSAKRNGKELQVSVSGATGYHQLESTEDLTKLERKASLQEIIRRVEDKKTQYTRGRSMSDGAVAKLKENESTFEVFPSLPNSVLEKMGLRGDGPRERLSEEELEHKFTSLALAFRIDATTVEDRCIRQKQFRDQTETNLSEEIGRLKEKLGHLQPLCTDCEKAELLSSILTKIDVLMNATSLVSTAAERFGSVQHEERLTESVLLMVSHVQLLKQQRDAARRQLQYTKRVLQNPSEALTSTSPTNCQKSTLVNQNIKAIGKRRASIATITQQIIDNSTPVMDVKKITMRTSDLSLRATSLARNSRSNRLELGGELLKIKEGVVETSTDHESTQEVVSENETSDPKSNSNISSPEAVQPPPVDMTKLSSREIVNYKFRKWGRNLNEEYRKRTDDGTLHEVWCFCALICFSFSLLIMVNILMEYEYAKRGMGSSHIFWMWTSGSKKN